MNLWGKTAEGRPSPLKSFQNVYGILSESLGTCVQSLGKLWEILSECLWNPGGISGNLLANLLEVQETLLECFMES